MPFLLVGLALLLTGLLAVELQRSHDREVESAERVTGSLARILEREVLASIGKIDLIVQEAQYLYAAHLDGTGPAAEQISPNLARLLGRIPGVLSLRLVNEQGHYVFDAQGKPSGAVIADRKYFRIHQPGDFPGLFAEGPLFSRVAGMWTFTFSRGVRDREGHFRGIVQSSIPSKSLATAFGSMALGGAESVALVNTDLVLIARAPEVPEQIGKPFASPLLAERIRSSSAEGSYTAASAVDGVVRIYSYRRVEGMPFYILAGISKEKALAEWRRKAAVYAAVALLMLAGGILPLLRTFRKLEASQAAEQLRALAGHGHELHSAVAVARDGEILFSDVSAARMFMRPLSDAEIAAYQRQAAPGATGTDANAIQLTRAGVAAGLIGIPNRYMHTQVEVVSLTDLENSAALLAEMILKITPETDFIPR